MQPFINLTFYETYYFANLIKNVLDEQIDYLRTLDNFYGDQNYLAYTMPFAKFSALHSFIHFLIDDVMSDDTQGVKLDVRHDDVVRFQGIPSALDPHPSRLPVNLAMERFEIVHASFDTWLGRSGRTFLDADDDDVVEYYDHLREEGHFDDLLDRVTAEVFFVLFQNRNVLLLFNDMMAAQMLQSAPDIIDPEYAMRFVRPGVLRRVAIPTWVQRAVFFRDRGVCVLCSKNLTGIVNIWSEENYDHIVSLAAGGLNDVTNIQLLCRECNSKKRAGVATTSCRYEAWYDIEA